MVAIGDAVTSAGPAERPPISFEAALQRWCLEKGLLHLGNNEYECPYYLGGCELYRKALCIGNMYVGNHGANEEALRIIQASGVMKPGEIIQL